MLSSHSAPSNGVLAVNVIEARNLHKEDLAGHNDPYLELWFNKDYKQKTNTVSNTENPVWNNTFTFNVEKGDSHKLCFKVYDKDKVGEDKIGEGHLDVSEAFKGVPLDTWAKLPAKLGLTSHGEVHFHVTFSPTA